MPRHRLTHPNLDSACANMGDPSHQSETELARGFVQPRDNGEPLPVLLHRCIPRIQNVRAKAYGRLNAALRRTTQGSDSLGGREPGMPDLVQPATDYRTICANVTEDLKLASEAVIELRAVVQAWLQRASSILPDSEISTVLQWLDALQDLEEKKLVATVSLHALQRSANQPEHTTDPPSEVREKASKYAKELNRTDQDINDLLQEIMEYYIESQEKDGVA